MGRYRENDRFDRTDRCSLTWQELQNASLDGNLRELRKEHIGSCFAPCPYSTQAIFDISTLPADYEDVYGPVDIYLKSRAVLGFLPDPLVDHTNDEGKVVYMQMHYSGVWGYICMFDGCPHYLSTGKRYFYI